jgi:RimJ/RimL family protein N-acetyltransferase
MSGRPYNPNVFADVVTTERLVLRPARLDDAPAIFDAYCQDPEVTRYLTWRPKQAVQEIESFLLSCVDARRGGTRWPWMLCLRGSDQPFGMIEMRMDGHAGELGYVLARSRWGRGFMPEAARAVTRHALAQPHVFRVSAVCDVDNTASARVLEKIGMQREGRLKRYIVHPNVSDEPRDVFLYAVTR